MVLGRKKKRSYLSFGQSLEVRINLRRTVVTLGVDDELPYINYTVADSWIHTGNESRQSDLQWRPNKTLDN